MPDPFTTLDTLPAPELDEHARARVLTTLRDHIAADGTSRREPQRRRTRRWTRVPRRAALTGLAGLALGSVATAFAVTHTGDPYGDYREVHYYAGSRQVHVVRCPRPSGPPACTRPASQMKRYGATTYDIWDWGSGSTPPSGR
jgi:hypothetical protein